MPTTSWQPPARWQGRPLLSLDERVDISYNARLQPTTFERFDLAGHSRRAENNGRLSGRFLRHDAEMLLEKNEYASASGGRERYNSRPGGRS